MGARWLTQGGHRLDRAAFDRPKTAQLSTGLDTNGATPKDGGMCVPWVAFTPLNRCLSRARDNGAGNSLACCGGPTVAAGASAPSSCPQMLRS